ncbi:glucose-6-phosphate dehydrogenase [Acidithiobacillus sp. IBUN Pt1247-S3]|uniref:glucose-6-phosphate dehydrogenase n=1 Tax=Acidithiobacillus sp. IBUN Pt1247-S3 TaxID=3166642 RepID=UPI0034E58912
MSDDCICQFVIFGATGDLASRKLLPSLYHLQCAGLLPKELQIQAVGRRPWDDQGWLEFLQEQLESFAGDFQQEQFDNFAARFHYVRGELHEAELYQNLAKQLTREGAQQPERSIFYLAIRPQDFFPVMQNLSAAGFNRDGDYRIVIEKPFGNDLESAIQLNEQLHRHFREEQIYRIDHYLGKEIVQNLMVFRFANLPIEAVWNRNFIDHVQITVAEELGVENRAGYYDQAGALRDMVQNHLMQILTLVAMEPPPSLEADALRDEKVKVLRSIRPIPKTAIHAHAIRAQYGPGVVDHQHVPGYADEPGVAPNSITETFVAAKFYVDNWRWRGVPFYLRTGKRMPAKSSSVAIRFRHTPQQLFRETPIDRIEPNWILLSLEPESLKIELHVKEPGLEMRIRPTQLNASYRKDGEKELDAYEALLLDVMEGDKALFIRFDEVEWAWRAVDPFIKRWAREMDYIITYPAGTWGPEEATRIMDKEDQYWRNQL